MIWNGMTFISKTPDNFAEHVRRKVIEKAMSIGFTDVSKIGKRKDSPEMEASMLFRVGVAMLVRGMMRNLMRMNRE